MVEVPSLADGYSYGPARVLEHLTAQTSTSTSIAGASHTHSTGRPLAEGDEVLVAFVDGSRSSVVIVGRILPAGA